MEIRALQRVLAVTTLAMIPSLASGQGSGFCWADKPTESSYTPNATYSYNSRGGSVSIDRLEVGVYRVMFAKLGGQGKSGGNVQVTAYGRGCETCKVENWGSDHQNFVVKVRCFGLSGEPVDTQYTMSIQWPGPGQTTSGQRISPVTLDETGAGKADKFDDVWSYIQTLENNQAKLEAKLNEVIARLTSQ